MCGVAARPSLRSSRTVSSVPSRVDPPAPKVTEQNAGLSSAIDRRAARSFSTPSAVFGGKNSTLKIPVRFLIDARSSFLLGNQSREQPGNDAEHDRAKHGRPKAADMFSRCEGAH